MIVAGGGTPYAIGVMLSNGWFHCRCVRFGKLAASYERRHDEEIRVADIRVAKPAKPSKPLSIDAQLAGKTSLR